MAVKKADIAASILAIAEAIDAANDLMNRIPDEHRWVLDDRFKKYWRGILFIHKDGGVYTSWAWRTNFDAGIGRWLPVPLDQENVSQ